MGCLSTKPEITNGAKYDKTTGKEKCLAWVLALNEETSQ
jgi:hypothetical protein